MWHVPGLCCVQRLFRRTMYPGTAGNSGGRVRRLRVSGAVRGHLGLGFGGRDAAFQKVTQQCGGAGPLEHLGRQPVDTFAQVGGNGQAGAVRQ